MGKKQKELQLSKELQEQMARGRFGDETYEALNEELVRGKYNKAHPWYRPSMSRQDATEHLIGLSEGCFIVREATRFNGLLLGVKTRNEVLHIKIREMEDNCLQLEDLKTNDDKTYTAAQTKQPKFGDVVMIINYYAESHEGVPFVLKFGNDSYDNSRLLYGQTEETPYVPAKRFAVSPGAPPVPVKESSSVGNPLYDVAETLTQMQRPSGARSVMNDTYSNPRPKNAIYDSGAPTAYDDLPAGSFEVGDEASYGVINDPVYDDESVGSQQPTATAI